MAAKAALTWSTFIIVDFNLNSGTFSFIDREDLKLASENRLSALADYFVLTGSVYGCDAG